MHIKSRVSFLLVALTFIGLGAAVLPRPASASWPGSGRVICDEPAIQQRPVITSDGADGAIIAWEDHRTPTSVIAVQHVLASGDVDAVWPHFGRVLMAIPLVNPAGGQFNAAIVPDGAGGAIVTWEDARSNVTGTDIYAQHVLATGKIDGNWPPTGVPLSLADDVQIRPIIVSDAAGGAIVAWTDARPGASLVDVYAQRVLASGLVDPAWPANGLPVATAAGAQAFPAIVGDGNGGALIAWFDERSLVSGPDIYVQHVLVSGVADPAWPVDGRAACTAANTQAFPTIATDRAHGAIVAWTDSRSGVGRIFAHHMLASGVVDPVWPVDGRVIANTGLPESNPLAVSDEAGGAVITWERTVGFHQRLFADHVTAAGVVDPAWPAGGTAVITTDRQQTDSRIVQDGAGGAIITWDEDFMDVFAQHVLATGVRDAAYPATTGRVLCDLSGQQGVPTIVAAGVSGAIVTWLDTRSGSPDVYALQVLAAGGTQTGVPQSTPPAVALAPAFPNPARGSLTLRFVLPHDSVVGLAVYDVSGRRVRELVSGERPGGENVIAWDMRDEHGRDVAAGIYFARLEAGQSTFTQKLVRMK